MVDRFYSFPISFRHFLLKNEALLMSKILEQSFLLFIHSNSEANKGRFILDIFDRLKIQKIFLNHQISQFIFQFRIPR